MLPRKRLRPNPAEASSVSLPTAAPSRTAATSPAASTSGLAVGAPEMPPSNPADGSGAAPAGSGVPKQVRKTRSWYDSWPRTPKATASTSVARENIFGDTVKSSRASALGRFESKQGSDTTSISSTADTMPGLSKIPENRVKGAGADESVGSNEAWAPDSGKIDAAVDKAETGTETDAGPPTSTPQRPATSSAWMGWWSKTPSTEMQVDSAPVVEPVAKGEAHEPRPSTPPAQTAPAGPTSAETPQAPPSYNSWFGFWPSTSAANGESDAKKGPNQESAPPAAESQDVVMKDAPAAVPPAQSRPAAKPEPPPTAGSTWAFWSKDSPKAKGRSVESEAGEIAVIGEGSETHPKPMAEGDVSGAPSKDAKGGSKPKDIPASGKSTWRKNKRLRPASMDIEPQSPSPVGSLTPTVEREQSPAIQSGTPKDTPKGTPRAQSPAKADSSNKAITESESSAKPLANLLLPSFSSTYQMKDNPSILKQLAQFLLRTQQPPATHVLRVNDPPKIRKAIAIGVHGLFPATYLRPMIGQPTGTSLRLAGLCADAIRRWADAHGCGDCDIEKVALEGDGKINERVDNLWKLMLNWIDHIRRADLIVIACHSQGVPVSVMLLDKLIDLGIITNAKIGVCAMAGVALGPFPEYKSSIFMGSAAELWDFGNPQSSNSQRFEAAMKHVLDYGARITFIGSIDDQVVPLESALYSPASHPYIYRAVFIDGRTHAPDFIAHLVGFALKLRNLGVSDHGLIRELSQPLAGSLYSGEGHSRLYYDDAVYDLSISHTLETTPAGPVPPCVVRPSDGAGAGGAPNPYVLPWIMRGLLEEGFVKTELGSETEELLRQFDAWKPTNKALKDVKYRLEAVRSRL